MVAMSSGPRDPAGRGVTKPLPVSLAPAGPDDEADASTAHAVGYNSQSQFTREFRRLFGKPPLAEVQRLQQPSGHPLLDAGTTSP